MARARKSSEEAATDLLLAAGLLVRRLRQEGASRELITWTQVAIMHRLEAGPATVADLARSEFITPQSMGGSIAALEEQGFVERKPHPTDGRQFLVALTPAGERVRKLSSSAKQAWLTSAIGGLGPEDREALLAAIDVLRKLGEQ
jgi:DNA-binding MarR family transcriptional regulator